MGLLDNVSDSLKGMLGQMEASTVPALLSTVLGKTDMGSLQGLVDKLQQGGLGPQVQSWLSNGQNLPISPEQLQAALGNPQIQELAQHFGVPVDSVLKFLSEHLPSVVDQASPDGTLKS